MIVFDKLWDTMKEKNISTYTLREKHGFHSRTIRRLRSNENITTDTLDTLCNILDCELSDIITHVKEYQLPLRRFI
ncbi:MAG: helix-turn-helix transcriptional regulator [Defluviitaleaceae bacterium]|nr:helix-turn-helix transcriptional regulator [Defluviitaleaceae bacterium]